MSQRGPLPHRHRMGGPTLGCGEKASGGTLLREKLLAGFAVDGAVEGGENGFAVLCHDHGGAGGEFAELFGSDDGGVFAVGGDGAVSAVLVVASGDAPGAEEVADLAVEAGVFGAAEDDQAVGEVLDRTGLLFPEDARQPAPVGPFTQRVPGGILGR